MSNAQKSGGGNGSTGSSTGPTCRDHFRIFEMVHHVGGKFYEIICLRCGQSRFAKETEVRKVGTPILSGSPNLKLIT